MKIIKNEFDQNIGDDYEHPVGHLLEVLKPFSQQISRTNIEIYIVETETFKELQINQDWMKYKLILFNII
jgi:hypothetical protein